MYHPKPSYIKNLDIPALVKFGSSLINTGTINIDSFNTSSGETVLIADYEKTLIVAIETKFKSELTNNIDIPSECVIQSVLDFFYLMYVCGVNHNQLISLMREFANQNLKDEESPNRAHRVVLNSYLQNMIRLLARIEVVGEEILSLRGYRNCVSKLSTEQMTKLTQKDANLTKTKRELSECLIKLTTNFNKAVQLNIPDMNKQRDEFDTQTRELLLFSHLC